MRTVRIFVSSPGDVGEERAAARRVLEQLGALLSDRLILDPIIWEDEAFCGTKSFQDGIFHPADCDIVVCIVWSRMGTPLPERYRRSDGSRYESGTQYEIEMATEAAAKTGKPTLLVYRKTAKVVVDLSTSKDQIEEKLRQKERLDRFLESWSRSSDGQSLARSPREFASAAQFEDMLLTHLKKLLLDLARAAPVSLPQDVRERTVWHGGSPFRGLEVFDVEHHAQFFGRTAATSNAIDALRQSHADGLAFLLMIGGSGSGKSSLARAGLLPRITVRGVIEGVGRWLTAIMKPSDGSGDFFDALAAALTSPSALPELARREEASTLATLLRDQPERAAGRIESALAAKGGSSGEHESIVLLLLVDQLEEVFTIRQSTPEMRTAFACTLQALAETGSVWIVATARSDFYHKIMADPGFAALKGRGRQFDVLPPSANEIGEMIRKPAELAGLRLEESLDTGERLEDVLRDAAASQPQCLPLLQFTLQKLYSEREGSLLTLDAYRRMGGLEGAIARQAEEVFAALPVESREAFPEAVRLLTSLGGESSSAFVRRRVRLDIVKSVPGAGALVDAFLRARLLVADHHPEGYATISVSHEALLSHWPRMLELLERDRDLHHARSRLAAATKLWKDRGKTRDLLLPKGRPLRDAEDVLDAFGLALTADERELIELSRRRRRLNKIMARCVGTALVVLTLLSGLLAIMAFEKWHEAEEEKRMMQALATYNKAGQLVQSDPSLMRLVLRELPEDFDKITWQDIWKQLYDHGDERLIARYTQSIGNVEHLRWSPDGRLLAIAFRDEAVHIWRPGAQTSEAICSPPAGERLEHIAWSPAGDRLALITASALYACDRATGELSILTASKEMSFVAWSASGEWIAASGLRDVLLQSLDGGMARKIAFAEDIKQIASAPGTDQLAVAYGANVQILEFSEPFRPVLDAQVGERAVEGIAWSPDGSTLGVSTGWSVHLLDQDGSSPLAPIELADQEVHAGCERLAWKPDGMQIACAGPVGRFWIWSLDADVNPREFETQTEWSFWVRWSHDGLYLFQGSEWRESEPGEIAVYRSSDFAPGAAGSPGPIAILRGKIDFVSAADPVVNPARSWIASGSDDGEVRIWRASGPSEPHVLALGGAAVQEIEWSSDGRFLLAADSAGSAGVFCAFGYHEAAMAPFPTGAGSSAQARPAAVRWAAGPCALRSGAYGTRFYRLRAPNEADTAFEPIHLFDDEVMSAAVNQDASMVAVVCKQSEQKKLHVYSLETGEPHKVAHHEMPEAVERLEWNGSILALASASGAITLINGDDNSIKTLNGGPEGGVTDLSWSPDGRALLAAARPKIYIWSQPFDSAATEIEIAGWIRAEPVVAWSHNDERFAFSAGERVLICEAASAVCTEAANEASVNLLAMAWSPCDTQLLMIWQQVLRLYGANVEIPGEYQYVNLVRWSPDGRRFAVGDTKGNITIFTVGWRNLRDRLWQSTAAMLTTAERREYLGESSDRSEEKVRAHRNELLARIRDPLAPPFFGWIAD